MRGRYHPRRREHANVANVTENIVLSAPTVDVRELIVHTSFDGEANFVHFLAFGVRCIVVESVFAPLCGVIERTCDEGREVVEVVFGLPEHAGLGHEAIVVALHNVAHGEFLVHKGIGAGSREVFGLHVLAIAVNVVSAVVKVGDFVGVRAHIVTQVETP